MEQQLTAKRLRRIGGETAPRRSEKKKGLNIMPLEKMFDWGLLVHTLFV